MIAWNKNRIRIINRPILIFGGKILMILNINRLILCPWETPEPYAVIDKCTGCATGSIGLMF